MLNEYKTSTPLPTDYFSQVFANIRLIRTLFEERYILDHSLNKTDLNPSDGHNKLTLKEITVDLYSDKMPYPMNQEKGLSELPSEATILFFKNVSGTHKLCYANKINGVLKETMIC
jgi:hypothetical protein